MASKTIRITGGTVVTASDTYEEIRLARRRAKPRRRPRVRVSTEFEAEPELHEQRRAA